MKMIGLCLTVALLMSGCASVTKSVLTGAATGAAVGGASGAMIDKQNSGQAALTSALVMGLIGGVAGYFTHDALESRDTEVRRETLFNIEKFGVSGFPVNPKSKEIEQKSERYDNGLMYEMRGGVR